MLVSTIAPAWLRSPHGVGCSSLVFVALLGVFLACVMIHLGNKDVYHVGDKIMGWGSCQVAILSSWRNLKILSLCDGSIKTLSKSVRGRCWGGVGASEPRVYSLCWGFVIVKLRKKWVCVGFCC